MEEQRRGEDQAIGTVPHAATAFDQVASVLDALIVFEAAGVTFR